MSGAYVACFLDADAAQRFAVDGGEPADSLHVTLAAFGDLDDEQTATVQQAAARLAFQQQPLAGVSAGFGVFRAPEVGKDVFWATLDLPGLFQLRDDLIDACCEQGVEPLSNHDFTPHLTLAYFDAGAPVMIGPSEPEPLTLAALAVVTPDTDPTQRQDLPFLGVYVAKDEPGTGDVHVDVPLGSGQPRKRKLRRKGKPEPAAPTGLLKADDERQIVYGIVLQPDIADSQGDVVSKEEIEAAAWRFLYSQVPEGQHPEIPIGLQHIAKAPWDVRPVESFLAPCDFTVETPRGAELVRKGSWIVATHVPDPDLWEMVKRDGFTGYSIAGKGKRSPLPVEKDDAASLELPGLDDGDGQAQLAQGIAWFLSQLSGGFRKQDPAPVVNVDVHVPAQAAPVVNVTMPELPAAQVTVNVPEQPAPVVHHHHEITVPEQPAPVVHVAAPQVHVEPQVTVEAPKPRAVKVKRDAHGNATYEPVG